MSTQLAERRVLIATAELRAKAGRKIQGYAAVYNKLSAPIPVKDSKQTFRERILPGAFRAAVDSKQDVTCLLQHDMDKLLGRTSSGTLQLREDSKGLAFSCDMPDTQLGRDTLEMIQRGDLNACSFGFMLGQRDQEWDEEDIDSDDDDDDEFAKNAGLQKRGAKCMVRTIRNIPKLFDVSVVTRAAYPNGTCVMARGESIFAPIPAEVRSFLASRQLEGHVDEPIEEYLRQMEVSGRLTLDEQQRVTALRQGRRRELLNYIRSL